MPDEAPQTANPSLNIPSVQSREDVFDAIYDEVLADAEAEDTASDTIASETDEDTTTEESDEDTDTTDDEDTDTDTTDENKETDDTKTDDDTTTDSTEDEPEPTAAETIIKLLQDKETLNKALEAAGVDNIQDLPILKDILGRERQSAADQTKAELAKQQYEEQTINKSITAGVAAKDAALDAIDALAKAIEDDEGEISIPDRASLETKFEEYARGQVNAYHTKSFMDMAETIYSLPQMQALSNEQIEYLAEAKNLSPTEWLSRHVDVLRNNTWEDAQNDIIENANNIIKNQTELLQQAHKADLDKLKKSHEKQIEKVKKETRASVMAEFAKNGAPPRIPTKTNEAASDDDGDDDDGTIEGIFRAEARKMERAGANV